jgi:hypothetical protein
MAGTPLLLAAPLFGAALLGAIAVVPRAVGAPSHERPAARPQQTEGTPIPTPRVDCTTPTPGPTPTSVALLPDLSIRGMAIAPEPCRPTMACNGPLGVLVEIEAQGLMSRPFIVEINGQRRSHRPVWHSFRGLVWVPGFEVGLNEAALDGGDQEHEPYRHNNVLVGRAAGADPPRAADLRAPRDGHARRAAGLGGRGDPRCLPAGLEMSGRAGARPPGRLRQPG